MKKVFLDSSVLIAACASKSGASALILGYCRKKKITGFISLGVIGEARKNVLEKLDVKGFLRLKFFIDKAGLKFVSEPKIKEIIEANKAINEKDAPILAAAIKSQARFIITLDRKHFLKPKVHKFAKPLKILIPGDFVIKYLK